MQLVKNRNVSSIGDRAEIKNILDNGYKIYNRFGIIFCTNDLSTDRIKVAILIKKNVGNAVKRNYIKRIIRHFIRDHITLLHSCNRVIFLYWYQSLISYQNLSDEYKSVLTKKLCRK